jgi:two-component system cell cycle response regulator DivK
MTAGVPALVVDDNLVNLRLAVVLLRHEGFDVRTVRSAPEALALLATWRPRIILMDVQLPGMDGLSLAAQLKAGPHAAGIAIIAMTAYAMRGDKERALAAGCDGYITKPLDVRRFAALVREVLDG